MDYDAFERLLRSNTKVVVCTHGSNLTGNVLVVERVGAFCRDHGLLFVLDASQTAGPFPIDMERQHIDVVCFTGHKSLLGPQGTGGLCVGTGVEIRPLLVGGGVGIPPLYSLAKRLTAQGKRVTAVLGFNRASEIFLAEESTQQRHWDWQSKSMGKTR